MPERAELPVRLALSGHGPRMTSRSTRAFLAGARIARHLGRPGTPNDQAGIESFFGHRTGEHPHLDKIRDPGELERELDRLRGFSTTVRIATRRDLRKDHP